MNSALVMEGIVELLSIFLNIHLKDYCYTYTSIRKQQSRNLQSVQSHQSAYPKRITSGNNFMTSD